MFCPKCGSENFDTNKFCKKCGRQLPVRPQATPGSHSLLGQVLDGKYRIDAKLGSGGMGDVYRAHRLMIGDSVAIKILHPHLAADPQAAERFRREAVTATQLRHRNVVALYDVGVARGIPFILMEMAEGFSLRQIINEYRILPLDFVVTVTAQVSAALEEAHRLGIVHRDIKPENIIANEAANGWQIKILDFGIAKLYNQSDIGLTQDGSAMGTPQYMSPEQCLGEHLDGRSDLYSLGIVLYEMLCGTVPFKAPAASAVAVFQVQKEPPPPRSINPDIHPEIEAVILRSLAKSPDDRPRSAQALSQELIKAATNAFKSGFTSVSAEPISAPDVAPEFDAEGSTIPSGETSPPAELESEASEADEPNVSDDAKPRMPSLQTALSEMSAPSDEPEQETVAVSTVPIDQETIAFPNASEELKGFAAREDESGEEPPLDNEPTQLADEEVPDAPELRTPIEEVSPEGSDARVVADETAPEYRSAELDGPRQRRLAIVVGALIFVGLIFVSGIAAGVWFFATRQSSPSVLTTQPAAASAQPEPAGPPGMAHVSGGEFVMGSDDGDKFARPAHKVSVQPFYIDVTEVTNEEYKKFVIATGRKPPPDWKDASYPNGRSKFPVTGVDWNDADAYAKWAGKRLPTEAEWEFAARGTDGRTYPWGKDWVGSLANAGSDSKGLREVGQGGQSPFGLYDMSGNAWEWTASDAVAYPGGVPFDASNLKPKIIRGGCWRTPHREATTTNRAQWGSSGEKNGYAESGFRCAKDVGPR